jgi:hypothetical protein
MRTPVAVTQLRDALGKADVEWAEVRDYPEATFLPASMHTIWFTGETGTFRWGHNFEFDQPDVATVMQTLAEVTAHEEET